ncbi:MAG: hypothetical protein HY301_05715 [Verrucomicrobia bacterium]|nr:hypothetical protein [Verrucomicrobiota bacterium]
MQTSNTRMLNRIVSGFFAVGLLAFAASAAPLFEDNFEKTAEGTVPEGYLVIDGGWAVKADGANKVLELPGAPLDTFSVLFGPSQVDGVMVSARARSEGQGRRFPAFAVGLNGGGGYRLQVSAAKKALEIFRGEESVASVPFAFESGAWIQFKLQVKKLKDGEWAIEGKAWKDGTPEPKEWSITFKANEAPPEGRPSVWGNPFSGKAIQFDDLRLEAVK